MVTDPDYLMCWAVQTGGKRKKPVWKPVYSPFHNPTIPPGWDMMEVRQDGEYIQELIRLHGEDYIGKQVLIGIVVFQKAGEDQRPTSQKQYHGRITRITAEDGVAVDLGNGQVYTLPPDVSWLEPAEPAQYKIPATGESVTNPDFIVMWSVLQSMGEPI